MDRTNSFSAIIASVLNFGRLELPKPKNMNKIDINGDLPSKSKAWTTRLDDTRPSNTTDHKAIPPPKPCNKTIGIADSSASSAFIVRV